MPKGLTGRVVFWTAVSVVLVGAVFALLAAALQDLRAQNVERDRTDEMARAADDLQKSVLDHETGARAFVITGQDRFLEPWRQARGRIDGEAARLVALARIEDRPRRQMAAELRGLARAYLRTHSIPLVQLVRDGEPSRDRLRSQVSQGKRKVDALRLRFRLLEDSLDAQSARREAAVDAAGARALTVGLAGFALVLAGAAVAVAYLARTVTRPITRVASAAAELGAGTTTYSEADARQSGATREIVSLTGSFSQMARMVQEHRRRMERTNATLERRVKERTADLEAARYEALLMLAVAAEFRDDDTHAHTQRVGRNAALIAAELGMEDSSIELLRSAAPLHDVGKIGISDTIMLKPGRLTDEEFAEMRRHVEIGVEILGTSRTPLFHVAAEIALTHHERWDGTGYPAGLSGKAIPMAGRIVALVDVFDALTHERPYKEAWPLDRAVAEIRRSAGSHFDPAVVAAFDRLDPADLLEAVSETAPSLTA